MKVIISAKDRVKAQDIASLRAWLDAAGSAATWTLAPESDGTGDHLGFGVGEICAIIAAVEGLPPLIAQIKSWFTTRQEPASVTLTITIDRSSDDITIRVPGRE